MLNNEEECRLAAFLGVLRHDQKKGVEYQTEFKTEAILWLAEQLEKSNNELKMANRMRETREVFKNKENYIHYQPFYLKERPHGSE